MPHMFSKWLGHIGFFAFAAAAPLWLLACTHKTTTDKNIDYVNSVEAEQLIHGEKRLFGLAGTAKAVFVDPRTPADFRTEHIPGAINVPYEDLTEDYTILKEYDVVIVYGSDYNDPRALGYSKSLIELGHKDVRTLNGGLRAWKADGNPVETGDAKPAA